MSSKSETKYYNILGEKPYITKDELSVLIGKEGKNLDKKVLSLIKKGELFSLKNGLYVSKDFVSGRPNNFSEFVANILYFPSYLSLEYVLQRENLIPEGVFIYTSVTLKVPRVFENTLGTFRYRNIKQSLFCGFEFASFWDMYKIKIASKAKALFDFLYLHKFEDSVKTEIMSGLRINWGLFSKSDLREFLRYVKMSDSKKMYDIYLVISKLIN